LADSAGLIALGYAAVLALLIHAEAQQRLMEGVRRRKEKQFVCFLQNT
jgi:hypothetical protein